MLAIRTLFKTDPHPLAGSNALSIQTDGEARLLSGGSGRCLLLLLLLLGGHPAPATPSLRLGVNRGGPAWLTVRPSGGGRGSHVLVPALLLPGGCKGGGDPSPVHTPLW